jgi:hypothetical protein
LAIKIVHTIFALMYIQVWISLWNDIYGWATYTIPGKIVFQINPSHWPRWF